MFETVDELRKALMDAGAETHYRDGWRRVTEPVLLDEKVETGGVSGGSCWGGNPHSYSTGKSFGEQSALDTFLEEFFPDVSFLRYRKLRREVVSEEDHCDREYYGNYTDYRLRIIDVDKLLEMLNDLP